MPGNLSRRVADIYLEKGLHPEATPNEKGFPDTGQFAGKYLDSHKHFVYTFSATGGQLMAWGAKLRRVDQINSVIWARERLRLKPLGKR